MRVYSLDLREKVMAAYRQTGHKSKVCKEFHIARTTLDKWIMLEKKTQALIPLPAIRHGRPFSIKDMESFEEFIKTTRFNQIRDLIEPFEQRFGYHVSYSVLWRGLNKIGYTKKEKNPQIF